MSLNKVFFNGSEFHDVEELFTSAINVSRYVHIGVHDEDDQKHIKFSEELLDNIVDNWFDDNINEIMYRKLNLNKNVGADQKDKKFNYNFGRSIPMSIGEVAAGEERKIGAHDEDNSETSLQRKVLRLIDKYSDVDNVDFLNMGNDLRETVKSSLHAKLTIGKNKFQ